MIEVFRMSGKQPDSKDLFMRTAKGSIKNSLHCLSSFEEIPSNPADDLVFKPLIIFATSSLVTGVKAKELGSDRVRDDSGNEAGLEEDKRRSATLAKKSLKRLETVLGSYRD